MKLSKENADFQIKTVQRLQSGEPCNDVRLSNLLEFLQAVESALPKWAKERSQAEHLVNWLVDESLDLRCRNIPTGGGDYDVGWFVVEHSMAGGREIGAGSTPFEAMDCAFDGTKPKAIQNG